MSYNITGHVKGKTKSAGETSPVVIVKFSDLLHGHFKDGSFMNRFPLLKIKILITINFLLMKINKSMN